MIFKSSGANSYPELMERCQPGREPMRFGIEYLDHATRGIFQDDLILLGAPSGVGKTQLCCNIALANIEDGKKVHYIALEASRHEIERRLKYQMVSDRYWGDPQRPRLPMALNYPDWLMGKFMAELQSYEDDAAKFFETAFRDFYLLYKSDKFGIRELIDAVLYCADDTDLILVDHVHYFDFDDDNENRAFKEIAKTVRMLALEQQKPIILVAHLRKRDKQNEDLVPGLDEFHGSSDLYKIATKVITFSPGKITQDGNYETFFRIAKNRLDGGVTRFIGKEYFNPKRGAYELGRYQVGWAGSTRKGGFDEIDRGLYPVWARIPSAERSDANPVPRRQSQLSKPRNWAPFAENDSQGD